MESRGGHRREKYTNVYEKMVEAGNIKITGNVVDFVKHWYWDMVTVKGDKQSSSCGRETMNEISRTASKPCTLPSIEKRFISVDEEWFWKYVADLLGSVHDCYVGFVLVNWHVSLLGVPIQSYEVYKEEKWELAHK